MRRPMVLSLVLASFPAALVAQAPTPTSYTRMLLGAGGMAGTGPSFVVGVDHRKATSRLGLRLVGEYTQSGPGMRSDASGWLYRHSTTYGLQVLGTRPFREGRRIEPYLFAGVGVYQSRGMYQEPVFDDPSNPLNYTPGEFRHWRETSPELLWGFGTNVRVMGMTLFGDLKLPNWGTGSIHYGRSGTFKIGVRF
jgi:hypothetical protein